MIFSGKLAVRFFNFICRGIFINFKNFVVIDLNPNNEEANKKFQQINEANEVLSDTEKRKKYDQYGQNWQNADQFNSQRQRSQGGGFGGGFSGGGFGGSDFSDFFSSMFGGGGSRSSSRSPFKGQDFTTELNLNLLDAYTTHKQTLNVNGKQVRINIPAGVENGQKIKLPAFAAPVPVWFGAAPAAKPAPARYWRRRYPRRGFRPGPGVGLGCCSVAGLSPSRFYQKLRL